MKQEKVAQKAMLDWLSNPHELGNKLAEIECTQNFLYEGMNYYIFKFKKKSFFNKKWMVGVCGGYAKDSDTNCGHVFSEYKEYKHETEKQDAIEIIEKIKNYWKSRA